MSSDNVNERLSKLGVADNTAEIESLKRENKKLRKKLKRTQKELDIVRKNFDEALERLIESVRVIQQPNQAQPWHIEPGIPIQPYRGGSSGDPPPNTWITYTGSGGEISMDNMSVSRSGYMQVEDNNESHSDPQIYYNAAEHCDSFCFQNDNSRQVNIFKLSNNSNDNDGEQGLIVSQ